MLNIVVLGDMLCWRDLLPLLHGVTSQKNRILYS